MYPTSSINVIEYIQINPLHDYDEEYKNKLWYSGCFIWFFFLSLISGEKFKMLIFSEAFKGCIMM